MAFDFTLVIDDRLFMATDYGLSLPPNRSEAVDEGVSSGATLDRRRYSCTYPFSLYNKQPTAKYKKARHHKYLTFYNCLADPNTRLPKIKLVQPKVLTQRLRVTFSLPDSLPLIG